MEIELNIENLRNLCRICLGTGAYNLWEHKVNWNDNATENDSLEPEQPYAEAVTIHEVLEMYNDWQNTILELDVELQLICKDCLDELQPHYLFYKRLRDTNKQIKQLYEEAIQQEEDKATLTAEPVVLEQVEYDNNLVEYLEYATEHQQPDQLIQTEQCAEKINAAPLQVQSTLKQPERRKFVKNPKFILTGGVTQLLTHATGATTFDPPLEAPSQQFDTNTLRSPHKRKRKGEDVQRHNQFEKKERSNQNFFREHIPNTIREEETTNDYITVQNDNYSTVVSKVAEIGHEVPSNELTEYTSEEQYQELVTSNNTTQHLENEDEAEAALSYSTVSADDAGRSIYVCKYCPQAFTAPCFLLTHARKSHVCKYCSKAYIKTTDLYAHLRESHKDFKCKYCGKELSSNGNLRAHIKRIHPCTTTDTHPTTVSFNMGYSAEESGDGEGEGIYLDDTAQHIAEYLD